MPPWTFPHPPPHHSPKTPQAVTALSRQYRMCSEIMAVPNALVYSGQLRSGSPSVAAASLALPRPAALARHPAWLRPLLEPGLRVAFLDTDLPPEAHAPPVGEVQLREGTVNPGEAAAVGALVAALLDAGVPPGEIGVVSPYRAQVGLVGEGVLVGWEAQGHDDLGRLWR
jgi:DNA replication ATP-dependent helicase Dna2